MEDVEYLNRTISIPLSNAIAEAAIRKPVDPIEFIANFLLAFEAAQQRAKMLAEEESVLNAYREEIQRKAEEERKRKEEERRRLLEEERMLEAKKAEEDARLFAEFEKTEELRLQALEDAKRAEMERIEAANSGREDDSEERETVDPLLEKKLKYQQAREQLLALDKSKFSELKRYKVGNKTLIKVLRAFMYVLDYKPKEVKTWDAIRGLISPVDLLKKTQEYDPLTVQRKLKFRNVSRAQKKLTEASVKKVSFVAFLIYSWVLRVVELREEAVSERQKAKESGGIIPLGLDIEDDSNNGGTDDEGGDENDNDGDTEGEGDDEEREN